MSRPSETRAEKQNPKLADLARGYLTDARSDSLMPAGKKPPAKSSLKSTTYQVNRLSAFLGSDARLADYNVEELRRLLKDMEIRGLSESTRRGAVFGWRRFGAWLVLEGKIKADPAQQVRLPKIGIQKRALCSDALLADLLGATRRIADNRESAMAHAIYSVFAYSGLRRAELLNLRVRDIDMDQGTVSVNFGKGDKSRRVPILEEGRAAIRAWLLVRGACKHDYLWGGYDATRRLGDNGLRFLMRKVAAIAGHKGNPAALPHSIRHNFATRLMRMGVELDAIREWLGHRDIQTTARYLHTEFDRLAEIARLNAPATKDRRPILEPILEPPAQPEPPPPNKQLAERPSVLWIGRSGTVPAARTG